MPPFDKCFQQLAYLTFGLLGAFAAPVHAQSVVSHWHPWIEVGGGYSSRDGGNTGSGADSIGRGEMRLFAPFAGAPDRLLFGQFTGMLHDDRVDQGNAAVGFRQMLGGDGALGGFNIGGWAGLDVRDSDSGNQFWQISGGVELLSDQFDLRANYYGPLSDPQSADGDFSEFLLTGATIALVGAEEVAMQGFDGEIGMRIPLGNQAAPISRVEARAFVGGYYFDDDDAYEEISGAKGRLELRIHDPLATVPGSLLTLDYALSHDEVRGTNHDVGLKLRVPLTDAGHDDSSGFDDHGLQQWRMTDSIERRSGIVIGQSEAEPVEDARTGVAINRVVYADNANDISKMSAEAGDNSLIIANGLIVGQQALLGNQSLVGGGSAIELRGRRTGRSAGFEAPGSPAELTAPSEVGLVLSGSNVHVTGLDIRGASTGIHGGNGKSNVFLTNLTLEYIDAPLVMAGIHFGDDNSNITLDGVRTKDLALSFIFDHNNQNVEILNSTISGSLFGFVSFKSGNGSDAEPVIIRNLVADGIASFSPCHPAFVAECDSIVMYETGNFVSIEDSAFSNVEGSVVYSAVSGNKIWLTDNVIGPNVGAATFTFDGDITIGAGSTGNVNNTGAEITCELGGVWGVGGAIEFTDGTFLDGSTCTVP